jgi:hypothetical protein
MEDRTIAYAEHGYIKAKLSVMLQVFDIRIDLP